MSETQSDAQRVERAPCARCGHVEHDLDDYEVCQHQDQPVLLECGCPRWERALTDRRSIEPVVSTRDFHYDRLTVVTFYHPSQIEEHTFPEFSTADIQCPLCPPIIEHAYEAYHDTASTGLYVQWETRNPIDARYMTGAHDQPISDGEPGDRWWTIRCNEGEHVLRSPHDEGYDGSGSGGDPLPPSMWTIACLMDRFGSLDVAYTQSVKRLVTKAQAEQVIAEIVSEHAPQAPERVEYEGLLPTAAGEPVRLSEQELAEREQKVAEITERERAAGWQGRQA